MFTKASSDQRLLLTKRVFPNLQQQNKNWKREHIFKPQERLKWTFCKKFMFSEIHFGPRGFVDFYLFRYPSPHVFIYLSIYFYLFLGLEDVAAEDVALSVSSDVTENLQILGVMRHVEYPERRDKMGQQNRTWMQAWQHFLNVSSEAQQALSPFLWSFGATKINTVFFLFLSLLQSKGMRLTLSCSANKE